MTTALRNAHAHTAPPPRRPGLRAPWITLAVLMSLVVALGAGLFGFAIVAYSRADLDTAGKIRFENELAIPPLAESRVDGQGRRVFDLHLQQGQSEFVAGRPTTTWGANGTYLGPTLRAARGERVLVNVRNGLAEPTALHWHGMRLPARMDGGPLQLIDPGSTWSPTWRIDQAAATLWYHPHPHGSTDEHTYRGIAGLFLLDDPAAGDRGLPAAYGVDDIPLIVQDKRLDDNGQLDEGTGLISPIGRLGDEILVNGTKGAFVDVTSERVRLRLLNASTARVYNFGFADDRPFQLVGSDGGLLARPHETRRIQLSPGERAEVVVTIRPGERSVLRSYPPDLGADFLSTRFDGGDDRLDILELRAAPDLRPAPDVPAVLAEIPRLDPADAVQTRQFALSGRQINGRKMDPGRIDAVVATGSTEIWEIANQDGTPHSFHAHDLQFQVLTANGEPPSGYLTGWKDTVFVPPNEEVRIIARFSDHSDPAVPYMFHCHLLAHEDGGMMGQFVLVAPGQRPAISTGDPAGSAGSAGTGDPAGSAEHGH